jgi:hypothetical protein
MLPKEIGDTATGAVVILRRWGNALPDIAQPRRIVTGKVVGVLPNVPEVVNIETDTDKCYFIRLDVV